MNFHVLEDCHIWSFILTAFWQGKPPDWQDFVGIIILLLINSTISFIEENNAGSAAAALMARLALKAKVLVERTKKFSPYFCDNGCVDALIISSVF